MSVNVSASMDLVDPATGTISVPAGTAGTVQQTSGPTELLKLQVLFTPSSGNVTRWVGPSEVNFDDGKLGLARAYYVGKTLTIVDVRYLEPNADFTGRLGKGMILTAGVIEIVFSDSSTLRLRNNRNAGDLDIEMY